MSSDTSASEKRESVAHMQVRAILHDVTDMITGKAGHDYRATGGAVEALNPDAKGGVKAAQESSSHNHGGSITEDFVRACCIKALQC